MTTLAAPTTGALDPTPAPATPRCRFCGAALTHTLVDLGPSPLCESFLAADQLDAMEPFYPLHVRVCPACLLVQLPAYVAPEAIFREYAYFSAYSDSWVEHSRRYVEAISERLGLGPASYVVELASNDGYLLQHFVARGVPALGIEPAWNVAEAARARGVETLTEFFGLALARQLAADGRAADLVIGNNVLAQVPDLNDFVAGIAHLLKPGGVATLEFPHVVRLIEESQFDTIYHEHFSYFSAGTIRRIAEAHGLVFFDVEELPTHGGSLRVYLARRDGPARETTAALTSLLAREAAGGYDRLDGYTGFAARVERVKRDLLRFLIETREQGQRAAGYGAPGQGQHAAQLLRHPDRPAGVHRRPQPLQARALHPGHAHPDPSAGAPHGRATRRGPDPAVEPAGRDRRPAGRGARLGRPARGGHPAAGGPGAMTAPSRPA